jgi:hypothetical protein
VLIVWHVLDHLLSLVRTFQHRGVQCARPISKFSPIVRAGLQRIIADERAHAIDHAFARGVALHPDSDDDIRRATALATESINDEPWEKWW